MVNLPIEVDILGTPYSVISSNPDEDTKLKDADGYCDWTVRQIVMDLHSDSDSNTVGDINKYNDKVLRHEVIHAYLHESGLGEAATFDDEHFEQLVDWIAIQFPKLRETFSDLQI